jgi:hypothetical protein
MPSVTHVQATKMRCEVSYSNVKIMASLNLTPCTFVGKYTDVSEEPSSLILLYIRLRGGRMKAGFSETSVPISQITLRYIPVARNPKSVERVNLR